MEFIVAVIVCYRQTSGHLPLIGFCQEKSRIPITVKRVIASEYFSHLHLKGRHPLRRVLVECKRELNKFFFAASVGGVDLDDLQ